MGRIRTIKPEFPQSETVGAMSRDARLLFMQLWTIVDDAGRSRAASRMLASLLYPYDDDARDLIDGWLDELEDVGAIRRYEVDGSQYLEVCKWLEHQKIDRPSPSRLPEYREGSSKPREPSRVLDADLGPRTSTKDQVSRAVEATRPIDRDFEEFWKAYPRRAGANPKAPAEKLFLAAVKSGADPDDIIAGAKRCAIVDAAKINTEFIPQAVKWLRDKRWRDYLEAEPAPADEFVPNWDEQVQRFLKGLRWSTKWYGPEPGQIGCRVPQEILTKHGFLSEDRKIFAA